MEIFQRVQRQYEILGICKSSTQSNHQKYALNRRVLSGFLLYGYLISSQIVYIFYVANGFMDYTNAICSISSSILMSVCIVAIVFRRTTLFRAIDKIDNLIDTRSKYPKSQRFYLKINRQIERLNEFVFTVVMKIAAQLVMLPKCIVSFATYFITDLGRDSFELPYPMWFPFDSNTPIGYLVAVIIEYIILGYEFLVVACILGLFIGVFKIAISATTDIQRHILHPIDYKAQANENHSEELIVLFSEFIDAHTAIKQVEHDFSGIFQPIFMVNFTWSLSAISIGMLIIQVQILEHANIIPLLLLTISGTIALTLVFIFCELGQRMTHAFEEIELTIDQFDWYRFPIKIQRMLPMIIADAQQPVSFECFGSITCCRDVFKSIIHCAFSYFMVLRQLND